MNDVMILNIGIRCLCLRRRLKCRIDHAHRKCLLHEYLYYIANLRLAFEQFIHFVQVMRLFLILMVRINK
jgi:hypothetical protein